MRQTKISANFSSLQHGSSSFTSSRVELRKGPYTSSVFRANRLTHMNNKCDDPIPSPRNRPYIILYLTQVPPLGPLQIFNSLPAYCNSRLSWETRGANYAPSSRVETVYEKKEESLRHDECYVTNVTNIEFLIEKLTGYNNFENFQNWHFQNERSNSIGILLSNSLREMSIATIGGPPT